MPSATSDIRRSIKAFKYELIFSPIYGVFGSLGLYCFFNYMVMAAFHEVYRYPHFAPFCVLAGLASLCICVAALAGHVYCSVNNKSGEIPDRAVGDKFAVIIALVAAFFIGSCFLWEPLRMMVSAWIKAAEGQTLR